MNDDLKAYVDGELPPDAAERLRAALERDPALSREADDLRDISTALRRLPEPEPVGRAATLAALRRRPVPLWRVWAPALAACAAVLFVAVGLGARQGRWILADNLRVKSATSAAASLPFPRREAFVRFVRQRGGQVRRDGDGLRVFYSPSAHEEAKRRFQWPSDLPLPADGLHIRLVR